jgi:hypothetical protein
LCLNGNIEIKIVAKFVGIKVKSDASNKSEFHQSTNRTIEAIFQKCKGRVPFGDQTHAGKVLCRKSNRSDGQSLGRKKTNGTGHDKLDK